MEATDTTIWGIHAGKTGEIDHIFLKKNVMGLGWPEMGDLSKLAQYREAATTWLTWCCSNMSSSTPAIKDSSP